MRNFIIGCLIFFGIVSFILVSFLVHGKLSSKSTVSPTAPPSESLTPPILPNTQVLSQGSHYNTYYGSLHNHSNLSDGKGTPDMAYQYARDKGKLDFFGLADHAGASLKQWEDLKATANSYNVDGVYATFWGFEWTSSSDYGHVTVINTPEWCSTYKAYIPGKPVVKTFSALLDWLSQQNGIAFLNHPGREDTGHEFNHFTLSPSERIVGMELWNHIFTFKAYYYTDGYFKNDGNKSYYDEANSRGWKIGASGSEDNHSATWGTQADYRLGVLAPKKTREDIYEALKNRRFFSTLDKNLSITFEINASQMGSVIQSGTHIALITANDSDLEIFTEVKLFKNGSLLHTWAPHTPKPVIKDSLSTVKDDYYYIKVTQADGDEAISSPIYIQ